MPKSIENEFMFCDYDSGDSDGDGVNMSVVYCSDLVANDT